MKLPDTIQPATVAELERKSAEWEKHGLWLEKALKLYQYSDGHFWHCIAHDFPGEPCEEFCQNAQAALSIPDARAEEFIRQIRNPQFNAQAEAVGSALEQILTEMRGRGWNDRQVNDIVNGYANRIETALKGESK